MEVKELIETLGLKPEEIKTIEDFKTSVDNTFTRNTLINEESEPVKKVLGKYFGTQENELKKVIKKLDLEIDPESPEFKDIKGVGKKFDFIVTKYDEKNRAVLDDLTAKVGVGNDDKVKEWEKKYEKISQKTKDLQGLLDSTKQEYEKFQEQASTQIKTVKLDVLKKDALSKVKFKPDITEFERKGYISTIQEKYQFDIDENESIVVKDKKGSLIPSTKVTGTFKSIQEILEEEAIGGKLVALNGDAGKGKPGTPMFARSQQTSPQNVNGRPPAQVAPRLR